MPLKFTAKGEVDELKALYNALNASPGVTELKTQPLYRNKDLETGSQTFELTLTPAKRYQQREYKARDTSGYVYLLKVSDDCWKIGKTTDPKSRKQTFGVKLPFDVQYEHLIECSDMSAVEKGLHRRFAKKRLRGSEFFALNDADVAYVCSL